MRKKRRVLALLLVFCMTISGILPGVGTSAKAEDNTAVIDVTDYGVYPDSGKDSAVGIQDAIEAAKTASKAGKQVTIQFPEGRYDIYPDKAVERELYISNTVGADQNHKMKKIGIFLEDMDNVTIDGNNSLFMFHGKMTTFATIDCENIEFKNFAVDFQVPTVIDMTVESVEGNTAVLYIPECYNYQISGTTVTWLSDVSPYTGEYYWSIANIGHVQRFDTVTGLKQGAGTSPLSNVSKVEDLGNHRLKVTYNSTPNGDIRTGMCFEARPTVRDHAGTFFWKSKNVTMTSLDIHFLHGFGMVGQHSENITLEDVDFAVPEGSGRASAGYADFVQMSGCKGTININGCTFANPHDDPINIHGTFNTVTSISEDRKTITVSYNHNETAGFPNFFEGDEVEFMTKGNMITVEDSIRQVVKVDGPDGMGGNMGEGTGSLTTIRLTFDEAIPSEIVVGQHVVENITYTPEVHITNCEFKEVPTRGILVTTRKPIRIQNNTFDGMCMAGIYISDDAQGWYESGPVRDVIISDNVFTRGKSQAIFIEPTNPNVSTEKTVHSNITIENNIFFMENQRVLDAKSVKDLTFKNNKIYRQDPIGGNGSLSLSVENQGSSQLSVSDTVELAVSGSVNQLTNRLYRFNGCQNVVIEGNIYDGGVNAGSILNNMNASEITIKDDIMKVNTDNNTDKNGTMYYVSDDESVVKVSDTGIVTAVGAGQTDVTAYLIVGGRKFPTNSVTFTVNGDHVGSLPSGITVTAQDEKEHIHVGETITYTASLSWKDGETGTEDTSAVTWKVYDAETGNQTDKATITENGTLTAVKPGAVVVTASTVNGQEASKLVSIWKSGKQVASDITVEYQGNSDQYRASTTVEGGLEQDFTSQGLYQNQSPNNVLVKELPKGTDRTNLTLIFKLTGETPKNTWADAGIYLYDDADNYVALEKKHRDGTTSAVALVREKSQSAVEVPYSNWANVGTNPIWMKLEKNGSTVTAYFSADKESWTTVGSNDDCGFLSDNFKLAIASQGTTSGSITYSDVTVNGKEISLVEESVKPTAFNVEVVYKETESKLTATGTTDAIQYLVKWAVSDTKDGNYSVIRGAEGNEMTVTGALKGKYVKAAYVPVAVTGAAGQIVWSNAVQVTGDGVQSEAALLQSANALLESASVTGMTFAKGTYYYHRTAETTERSIAYAFVAEDTNAEVEVIVNGVKAEGTEGTAALQNGRNTVEVTVTAEDGMTMKYYRFTISRTGDNDSTLTVLKAGETELTLKEGVYEYTAPVTTDVTSVSVTAIAQSESTAVTILGENEKVATGVHSANGTVSVEPGVNIVTVRVLPETGAEPTYYTLKLKMPNASNARLESLSFDNHVTVNEQFDAETLNYTAQANEASVAFQVTAEEANAVLQVVQNDKVLQSGEGSLDTTLSLKEGENVICVKVTSADKAEEKVYTVTIQASGEVWLSDLDWVSESSGDSGNPTRKDKSCGGNTITLWDGTQEVTYKKGIGTHAPSTIVYDIADKGYTTFTFDYGIDREAISTNDYASIVFKVYLDDTLVFTSQEMKQATVKGHQEIDVTGASTLKLVMEQGSNNWNDHGDWADAKLTKPFKTTVTETYTVTATVNDPAMGTVTVTPNQETYEENTEVIVNAEAKNGYTFVNWTDVDTNKVVSTEATYKFTATKNVNLVANFEKVIIYYTVQATSSDPAMGTVAVTPNQETYEENTEVTVKAEAKDGYTFVNWTDADTSKVVSTEATYKFTATKNVSLVANFEKQEPVQQPATEEDKQAAQEYLDACVGYYTQEHFQTEEEWAAYQEAVKALEEVLAKDNLTIEELQNAMDVLENSVPEVTEPSEPEVPGTDEPEDPELPDTDEPGDENNSNGSNDNKQDSVQTGDSTSMMLWIVMFTIAVVVVVMQKRKVR